MDNQNMGGFPQQPQQPQQPVQQPYQQPMQQPMQQPVQQPFQQPMMGGNTAVMQQPPKKKKTGLIIGIVAGILVLALLVAILGSSSPEKPFYGTWTATFDATEKLKENLGENVEMLDPDFKYEFKATVTFNKDNTYTMTLDESSYNAAQNALVEQYKKYIVKTIKDLYPEYNAYSDDEIITLYEEISGESISDLSSDDETKELAEEFNGEGQFKVKDDMLMLSDGLDYAVDEDSYFTFVQVSDTEIKITDHFDISDPDNYWPPFVLTK